MYEDGLSATWEGEIRTTGHLLVVQPVAIPHRGDEAPNTKLWGGVLVTDPGHPFTALRGSQGIHAENIALVRLLD
jgi:hypothetical protein